VSRQDERRIAWSGHCRSKRGRYPIFPDILKVVWARHSVGGIYGVGACLSVWCPIGYRQLVDAVGRAHAQQQPVGNYHKAPRLACQHGCCTIKSSVSSACVHCLSAAPDGMGCGRTCGAPPFCSTTIGFFACMWRLCSCNGTDALIDVVLGCGDAKCSVLVFAYGPPASVGFGCIA
jgi:hypothetical protein